MSSTKVNKNSALMRGVYNNAAGDGSGETSFSENEDTLSILLVGDVGEWYEINKDDLYRELKGKSVSKIDVYLSTLGGNLVESLMIYDFLKGHKAEVTVYIFGIVASAGTVIACAGDRVVMSEQSLFMIHRAYFQYTSGTSKELRDNANRLEQFERMAVNVYKKKTGITEDSLLWDYMDSETWFEPQDALSLGFADEVVDTIEIDFETVHKPKTYYQEWYEDYYFSLTEDKTGAEAYRTGALNLITEGFTPFDKKATKMANKGKETTTPGILEGLFNLFVKGGLMRQKDEADFKALAKENPAAFSGVSDDAINNAVNKAMKSKETVSFSLKEVNAALAEADDKDVANFRALLNLATEEETETEETEEETETTETTKTTEETKEEETEEETETEEERINNLVEKKIAQLQSKKTGKSKSNGKLKTTAKNGDKKTSEAQNKMAVKAFEAGKMTAEIFRKITGTEPPSV